MKRQSGFTLIELIIVIVILGILAVTAAPQFFNFGSDARASTVRGLEGSIKAASEMVHARAQIGQVDEDGDPGTGFVRVRGDVVVELVGEYAAPTEDGILQALNLSSVAESDSGETADWYWNEDGDVISFYPAGRDEDETCAVAYNWDGADGNTPSIESVTSGC